MSAFVFTEGRTAWSCSLHSRENVADQQDRWRYRETVWVIRGTLARCRETRPVPCNWTLTVIFLLQSWTPSRKQERTYRAQALHSRENVADQQDRWRYRETVWVIRGTLARCREGRSYSYISPTVLDTESQAGTNVSSTSGQYPLIQWLGDGVGNPGDSCQMP
jgi:hypothetical protein